MAKSKFTGTKAPKKAPKKASKGKSKSKSGSARGGGWQAYVGTGSSSTVPF